MKYNDENRLSSATGADNTTTYGYSAYGERVLKKVDDGSAETLYRYINHYGSKLLSQYKETSGNPSPSIDYLYIETTPVAQISSERLTYIESDHLGTPRLALKPSSDVETWSWNLLGRAFGEHAAETKPGELTIDLRLPGQVKDEETDLYYNYFRYYDPEVGRYIESDPIGLKGGISTFGYAEQSPLVFSDPNGLNTPSICINPANAAACAAAGTAGSGGGAATGAGVASGGGMSTGGAVAAGAATAGALSLTGSQTKTQTCCPPCTLADGSIVPVGTIAWRLDLVPPSTPHWPLPGDHYHIFSANQNPNNCRCFWKEIDVIDGRGAATPPGGSIPVQPFR